ncbi:hypothetical protein E2C01_036680 [Portunus trituberculatus]|uniref:Uncharacterized protein n=1 Tax=Portunus trituberculatus TaxID=210409 RepID=A0A5B7FD44_PORTR|nr:hypothetical protein [Portunus trituberculatus]
MGGGGEKLDLYRLWRNKTTRRRKRGMGNGMGEERDEGHDEEEGSQEGCRSVKRERLGDFNAILRLEECLLGRLPVSREHSAECEPRKVFDGRRRKEESEM